ncbi:MAG: peptidase S41 [Acidimicrobiia bacterium]|nr:peptidase S41 [Acidimicrobiia bacterium]
MRTLLLVALSAAAVSAQSSGGVVPRPYFTEPAISPDRSEIAFVSGGDIWAVSAGGGEARLLLSHPANESRPFYSPDGKRLAFISNRTGGGDIYLLTFATSEVIRLTFDDGHEQLDGWSRDGRWIYFSSTSHDIAGMNDVFRVSADGGTPMEIAADRYTNEFFSAESPNGSAMAITARSTASGQWWRNGRSHLDEAEVWIARDGAAPSYQPVTTGGAKEMWPMWAADGNALFYVSDRGGVQNVWSKAVTGTAAPRQLTNFTRGRVLWPSLSADGRLMAFEHDFEIWTLDTTTNAASRVAITRRGAPAATGVEHVTLTEGFTDLALSPDGRKVAVVVRGEVFAASSKDGGDATRLTRTVESEAHLAWSPDSRTLVYSSDRDGATRLFLYDFTQRSETPLTTGADTDHSPRFSPDGKRVAFIRGDAELRTVDVASKAERVIARGMFDRPPFAAEPPFAWSPDGQWLAFLTTGAKAFTNVSIVDADGKNARAASFVANAFANTISWAPNGRAIYFDTGQRTEQRQIARIDLTPRTPQFREDQFRDLFREEPAKPVPTAPKPEPAAPVVDPAPAPASGEPIVFEGIRQRLSLLPTGIDAGSQRISPDGKTLLLNGRAAGQQNLYTFSIDELSTDAPVARQLTSTPGNKSDADFTPDGKEVYLLEQGRISIVTVENRQSRRLAIAAEMDVDFAKEKVAIFQQAWAFQRHNFFDPKFNGVNWNTVREQYAPLISGASTRDEMRRLLNLMVGELNASHLGVNAPAGGAPVVGKLGLRFDRRVYEQRGRFRVTDVIPLTPASVAGIRAGEYLFSVDGTVLGARVSLQQVLSHTINRRIDLVVATDEAGANRRTVAVRPTNQATEKNLLYRQWVEQNRAYVAKASGGRLGYVHMFDMSDVALNQLNIDLDTENHARDGVVIDVRNNNGGFVNMYALDVFARKNYLTMTSRGGPSAPGRSVLGQRALGAPTVLVTNQHSLSDAEDFTEGYRALKLGKVVGEPTSGWIVYTSNMPLIDGTILRIPSTRVDDVNGKMMEQAPRQVDVAVKRPVGESYTGRDIQLDAAVKELLAQLGGRQATP